MKCVAQAQKFKYNFQFNAIESIAISVSVRQAPKRADQWSPRLPMRTMRTPHMVLPEMAQYIRSAIPLRVTTQTLTTCSSSAWGMWITLVYVNVWLPWLYERVTVSQVCDARK